MEFNAPLYAQVELTYSCNLACPHCLNDARYGCSGDAKTQVVPKEKLEVLLFRQVIEKLREWGVFHITLTGGEPLTVRDRLFEALGATQQFGIQTDMNSNLCLMDEDTALRLRDGGLTGVLTSVSSYDHELHNKKMGRKVALNQTLRGIDILRRVVPELYVSSNMVLAKDNCSYDHVMKTGKLLADTGIQTMTVTPLTPSRTGLESQLPNVPTEWMMLEALFALSEVEKEYGINTRVLQGMPHCFVHPFPHLRKYSEAGCDAGRTYVTVAPNGEVKACSQIPDGYGNILINDLDVIWKGMKAYRDNKFVPSECEPCDLRDTCGGGCRAEAERRVGSLGSLHPFFRKPLILLKEELPFRLNGEVGQTYRVAPDIMCREEGTNRFVVRSGEGSYTVMSEDNFRLLQVVRNRGGLTITPELAEDEAFASFAKISIKNKILEVV